MTQRESASGALDRAFAYVRISSEKQRRHGYNLDGQEHEIRIQIDLRSWELVEVVRDKGLSRADPVRPGLRHTEKLAREGRVDDLATKLNRWFRNIERRRRYERDFRRMCVRIAALNDSGNAIAHDVDGLLLPRHGVPTRPGFLVGRGLGLALRGRGRHGYGRLEESR